MTGAIILKMSHGYTIEPEGPDPLVDLADQVLVEFSLSCTPGAWLVDVIPFCKHHVHPTKKRRSNLAAVKFLPDWLPGTTFKRIARRWRTTADELIERPHAFVKKQLVKIRLL